MRVAILDDYLDTARQVADWSPLDGRAEIAVFTDYLGRDEAKIAAALADFEVIVGMRERTPFPRSLIERLPKLKLLITTGMRNASFDLQAAAAQGVTVCATQAEAASTVELTWGLIHALARDIPGQHASMRAGGWQTWIGNRLGGSTLGLLGLGRIGRQVAAIGKLLGMEVIAWSQNLTAEKAAEGGATRVDKEELFRRADVLSIHLVLGDRSRGLIGAQELGLMKPTAVLVNTSRGPIVQAPALVEALRAKRIRAAGIDVYDVEPLPTDDPLRGLDNVILTPHLGYATRENYATMYTEVVEDIVAWLDGKPVRVIA
ncbi:MAG: D-2-hydroxyacid dehydrogenase family protein [Alphaproteobacteria bacterium]